jgi:hypothetical protein
MRARRHNAPTNPRTSVSRPKTAFEKLRSGVQSVFSFAAGGHTESSDTSRASRVGNPKAWAPSPASTAVTVPAPTPRVLHASATPVRTRAEIDFDTEIDGISARTLKASSTADTWLEEEKT